MRHSARVLVWLLIAAACGAPDTRVRDAANASYRIRRDLLWSEIIGAVRTRYPKMQIAVLDPDRLVTHWTEAGRQAQFKAPGGGLHARFALVPAVVRVTVTIAGRNPYRVAVDLRAGVWAGTPEPWVFAHNFDEPEWVPWERDRLALAIHERLVAYEHAR